MSEDPLGFAAGDCNVSRYVENSPISANDPSGNIDNAPLPTGAPQNGYKGLGSWVLMNESYAKKVLGSVLDKKVIQKAEWDTIARGCVGLAIVHLGPMKYPILPWQVPGSQLFLNESDAREALESAGTGNAMLYAFQYPGMAVTFTQIGGGQLSIDKYATKADLSKLGEFNVASWIPLGKDSGVGYWEYLSKHFMNGIDANDPPILRHVEKLPDNEGEVTVYGVSPLGSK